MSKRLYTGLGLFLILVISATVFKVVKDQSEIRQLQNDLSETQKQLERKDKPNLVTEPVIDFTKPPPGKTFENGGHWHNGEWHDTGHEPISDTTNPTELTDAELKKLLEEEAEWDARFAAEATENAKIHARKVADYNLAKNGHEIALKIADLNKEQNKLFNAIQNGHIPTSDELKQYYKRSEKINNLTHGYLEKVEEFNNEQK